MGYMMHHCIVVTGFKEDWIQEAHAKAVEIFGETQITNIVDSVANFYLSFMVGTDGSKEGWSESEKGDQQRRDFIAYLKNEAKDRFYWAEIQYHDDEGDRCIIDHQDNDVG